MLRAAALCALLPAAAVGICAAAAQDEAGQIAFNTYCRSCHTLRAGDNRLGPTLHDIMGRRAGSLPGYGYSGAMADSRVVWNEETLDRFIADPEAVVRNNRMKPYGGVPSAEERQVIVNYLKAQSGG